MMDLRQLLEAVGVGSGVALHIASQAGNPDVFVQVDIIGEVELAPLLTVEHDKTLGRLVLVGD